MNWLEPVPKDVKDRKYKYIVHMIREGKVFLLVVWEKSWERWWNETEGRELERDRERGGGIHQPIFST